MTTEQIASLIQLGAAGAVIAVVIIFLNFISKRDQEWREYFSALHSNDKAAAAETAKILRELIEMVRDHDSTTKTAIARMEERTRPHARTQE